MSSRPGSCSVEMPARSILAAPAINAVVTPTPATTVGAAGCLTASHVGVVLHHAADVALVRQGRPGDYLPRMRGSAIGCAGAARPVRRWSTDDGGRVRAVLVAGVALAVVGLVLIPLPGPGFLLLALAVPVLVVGVALVVAGSRRRS